MVLRQKILFHSLTRTILILRGADVEFESYQRFWRNQIPPSLKQKALIMEAAIFLETLVPLCQITHQSYNKLILTHRSETFTAYDSDVAVKLAQSAT
jgi:hypothetical protein